jgi:hypothetical protein
MVAILEAKQLTERALLSIPGVMGVGIGASSQKYIHIYVEEVTPEIEAEVPKVIAGYPVKIIKSGRFKALSLMQPKLKATAEPIRTSRLRPAMGGVSIGHPNITAGTLGGVIGGLILSNNHVLADVSTFENPRANIGDAILQPGKYDGGVMPNDQIATLHSYVPLSEKTPNLVDAAWAKPLNPAEVSEEILGIGYIAGIVQPQVDMQVQKSGRTTGVTTGKIIDRNATTTVDYDGLQLSFTDQVITEHMMDGGDSGSLGLDMNKNLWGLGFAGSDELTVFNKISNLGIVAPALPLFDLRKFIGIGLFVGLFLKTKGVL